MKTKVLLCGSAGFLMSNLLRYMLYRDEDRQYVFISLDSLPYPEDYKRVYIHKKHRFYIGDATDQMFLERIAYVEKPDIVVNGVGVKHKSLESTRNIVCSACSIHAAFPDARVLQITPKLNMKNLGLVEKSYWSVASSLAITNGGTLLQIPRCFGIRDRHGAMVGIIRMLLNGKSELPLLSDEQEPWAYAEDVASRIWYAMEHKDNPIMTMPAIGTASHLQMAKTADKILGTRMILQKGESDFGAPEVSVDGWEPDSENIEQAIMKTAQWYSINKWAL